MEINKQLIWDYEFNEKEREGESFRRWYITRALSRGRIRDVKDIGLDRIHSYLPHLFLPRKIRAFWEWFYSLPEIQKRYGYLDAPFRLQPTQFVPEFRIQVDNLTDIACNKLSAKLMRPLL